MIQEMFYGVCFKLCQNTFVEDDGKIKNKTEREKT